MCLLPGHLLRRSVSTGRLVAVVVGFHRDVISREPARRGVRRGAADVSGSGEVQHVWAWQPVVLKFLWLILTSIECAGYSGSRRVGLLGPGLTPERVMSSLLLLLGRLVVLASAVFVA